ncbi:DNA (cytosine-5-)-methyltransferase [Campylobacter sp. RM9344]|uniref:Cytosine-specific methyltransferase n=1 Tax=Campylobacter californiensis TaxID=1032243 RepID=A0AAW3ZYI4_9BACT|nr:DNA cytosine methyltransferase [Campylobacter sp. RM9337]MBE3030125.1 DNA (cytosine-5-)-methyltransferase [Campylobacter sp. RM9344]MBE3608756.1 DNA (cytosine-5-)-methyltransferase [Campylobacter sp. RM9337]
MTIATVFSGIGAPETAAKRVFGEFKTLFACEIDKFARQSYLANHDEPESFYADVCELDGSKYKGQIDILIGGSPCQDFSIAGARAGESGERGSLIWQFYRVVSEARPSIFVYENVKGFLSINHGKSYQRFLEALRNLGYHCYADVINTKDYGIPQNRERIYIVGFLDSELYHSFCFAPKQPLELNLGDMLDSRVDEKYYLSQKMIAAHTKHKDKFNGKFGIKSPGDVANTLQTTQGARRTDNFIKVIGELDIKGKDCIKRVYDVDGIAPTIHTAQGGNQEPKILQPISSSSFQENNLLNNGAKIRKLTPRECLRLQGFRDDEFKIVVSDTQAYKQAGNAMSVNVLEMIFRQILKAQEKKFKLGA